MESPGEFSPQDMDQIHAEALDYHHLTLNQRLETETDLEHRRDLESAITVAESVKVEGGTALAIGGYARDEALRRLGHDIHSKDIDLEVYGLEYERLLEVLDNLGEVNVVGASFGVIKLGNLDISIPRRDSKVDRGHKGFVVTGDPGMSVKEAARRRDFTMNALALNPLTGELIDEYGGLEDLRRGVIRATDPELFGDDPLRVLRAMQFAGRFGMEIDPETVELCRGLDLSELSSERVGEEWAKLLLKSPQPSVGLEAARQLGVVDQLHPELAALVDTPQEPEWHPEGDVWVHTKMVVDAAAGIIRREQLAGDHALTIMLAALCHDLGKPPTTTYNEGKGRITSHAHDTAGVEPTKDFLAELHTKREIVSQVTVLVREHLYPAMHPDASDGAVRRLAGRLAPATIRDLVMVAESDHRGRELVWDGFPQGRALLEKAEALRVEMSAPRMLVMGRHLLDIGYKEGPATGAVLRELYQAQLDGKFDDVQGGLEYLRGQRTDEA